MPAGSAVEVKTAAKQKLRGRPRAESQQTAIAILHHELARVPWHVGRSPSEFYALGCVLGIGCGGIFDEQVSEADATKIDYCCDANLDRTSIGTRQDAICTNAVADTFDRSRAFGSRS